MIIYIISDGKKGHLSQTRGLAQALIEQAGDRAPACEHAVYEVDITGLSCKEGEVDNSVFDRYLVPLYKEASYKPYIIAAMILLAKVKDPVSALMDMENGGKRKEY